MPSTAIERYGYDEATRELHITFVDGGDGVPKPVYDAFRAATSKGRFLNLRIKDRYDFRRHARSA